jgi:hypothetical protein
MKTLKRGTETAFPLIKDESYSWGMSKRFYAACAVMQGLCLGGIMDNYVEGTVKKAYTIADELLKQEKDEPI